MLSHESVCDEHNDISISYTHFLTQKPKRIFFRSDRGSTELGGALGAEREISQYVANAEKDEDNTEENDDWNVYDDDDGTHRICSKQLWDTKSNDSLSRMRIRSAEFRLRSVEITERT